MSKSVQKLASISILAVDNSVSKAYLTMLLRLGLEPCSIIRLNIVSRREGKQWRLKAKQALKGVLNTMLGVRKSVEAEFLQLLRECLIREGLHLPDYTESIDSLVEKFRCPSIALNVESINSPNVIQALQGTGVGEYIIFSGGGILRKPILNCGPKFIHVHPGIVPDIRGSDGLLWSSLVRGRIGMSAFFMNEGIDTGDVIEQREYAIPACIPSILDAEKWEIGDWLIRYADPVFRSELLKDILLGYLDGEAFPREVQGDRSGKVYYFMHDLIKSKSVHPWTSEEGE